MAKHALYFSHDSNARGDEKIVDLRMCLGWEGYGLYWAVVEMLSESTDYKMKTDYKRIAFALQSDSKSIKTVIEEHDLFVIEVDFFYSESLLKRMLMKESRSESARKSARARWDKKNKNANAKQTQCDGNAINKEINKEKKDVQKFALEQFNEFWQLYPKKKGKKNASTKFAILLKDKDFDFDAVIAILKRQVNQEQWTKQGGQFIPLPASWLNGELWNDDFGYINSQPSVQALPPLFKG
jgi:hypothetical protein